jgi:preprotein translocase subunit SecD
MINEKDSIKTILEGRGVISNGVFDELRFKKLVTEPWIYTKTIKYGFDKMNGNDTQVIDNEPVIEKVVEIQEPIIDVVEKSLVEEQVVEEVVETQPENVEVPTEEPAEVDENPIEQEVNLTELPAEEVKVEEPATEEVVETSKKKTSKKK